MRCTPHSPYFPFTRAPIGNSPSEMVAATRKEIEMLGGLAKAAGIEPE